MKIKFPVGATEENNQLLLEPGFVTFDSERKALRLHDGQTQGGFEVVGEQAWTPRLGYDWNKETLVGVNTVQRVTYGAGWFVGLFNGAIYRSSDAVNWVLVRPYEGIAINNIRYINGFFYAVGAQRTALRSTNGSSWSAIDVGWPTSFSYTIDDIILSDGRLTTCSRNAPTQLTVSVNGGTSWSLINTGATGASQLISLNKANTYWIIGGRNGIARGTNGANYTWMDLSDISGMPASFDIYNVIYKSGVYYALFWGSSRRGVLRSTDANTWAISMIENGVANAHTLLAEVDDLLVTAGSISGNNSAIYVLDTTDPVPSWTPGQIAGYVPTSITSLVYANNKLYAYPNYLPAQGPAVLVSPY